MMAEFLSYQDVIDTVRAIEENEVGTLDRPLHFFTRGTGIPDEVAIEYWKDTGIVVVDREWNKWLHGEIIL